VRSPEPPSEPVVWALGPTIARADIPGLCERLTIMLEVVDCVIVCDVSAVVHADVVTVDALAHLHMTAQRRGRRIRICGANARLLALVSLIGLAGTLPLT
jgi:ABC-type transporter Mla MlaB component